MRQVSPALSVPEAIQHPEIMTNRNTFNKKVRLNMSGIDKDGLSSTKFRIVNRKDYQSKQEIIEVVI